MDEPRPPSVGVRIRNLRTRRGLSLRDLAARCALSINAISRIERGENSPTVSSLHHLATALEVPITTFFEEPHERSVVSVRRGEGACTEAGGVVMESLGTGLRGQELEPFLMTIAPGAGNAAAPIAHPGQEFVYCVEGRVDYHVEDEVFRLDEGDSLLLDASQRHGFRNESARPATLLLVYLAPGHSGMARRCHQGTRNP